MKNTDIITQINPTSALRRRWNYCNLSVDIIQRLHPRGIGKAVLLMPVYAGKNRIPGWEDELNDLVTQLGTCLRPVETLCPYHWDPTTDHTTMVYFYSSVVAQH